LLTSSDAGRRPPEAGAGRRARFWSLRLFAVPAAFALLASLLAGCGAPAPTPSVPLAPLASPADPRSLHGLCPDPVVVQTGWYPTADLAAFYQLFGDGYRVDKRRKTVSGRFVTGGVDSGVGLEVRSGGPAIGYQLVPAQMYLDKTITLGTVTTDEAIQFSAGQPVVSVVAPLDGDPQILLWDPTTHPEFNSIVDIGQTDVPVVYYQGSMYMEYLLGTGQLRRRQVDGSYDGTPTRFTSTRGAVAIQGYATNEPYLYEHEVKAWGRPVRYQLVSETGYPQYANTVAVRAGDRSRLDGCLRRLVPMLQRAQVEFLTHPERTVRRIVSIVDAFGTGFTYSKGNADFAVRQLRDLGLSGNGNNRTLGDLDTTRLQRLINIVAPIVTAQHRTVRQPLRPADIATNEYVDPSIGLPD
jgi:hypothetical protein